jgi:Molybdopterin-binding domain of aldehyde dehydrogenase
MNQSVAIGNIAQPGSACSRKDIRRPTQLRPFGCALDCGTVINPDTVQAQVQGAAIYGITAALYGEITLKNSRGL